HVPDGGIVFCGNWSVGNGAAQQEQAAGGGRQGRERMKTVNGLTRAMLVATAGLALAAGCGKTSGGPATTTLGTTPFMSAVAGSEPAAGDEAPAAEKTDGFDGKRAYEQVAKQVSFGPRVAGSP